jgi:hypothetical protein
MFLKPVDQWIVLIRYFAPASVMNRKEINQAARNDRQEKAEGNDFPGQRSPAK